VDRLSRPLRNALLVSVGFASAGGSKRNDAAFPAGFSAAGFSLAAGFSSQAGLKAQSQIVDKYSPNPIPAALAASIIPFNFRAVWALL
jgi:hypothetical protein